MEGKRNKSKRKKFAGRNDRESRRRYWHYDVLKRHKVRNLVRCNGMSHEEAVALWSSVRTRRLRKG